MKILLVSAAFGLAALAAPAFAADGPQWYGNLGYTHHDGDASLGTVDARVGALLTPHFGLEGEFGVGVNDDTVGGFKVDAKSTAGIYAIGVLPVSDKFDVFARIGYGQDRIKVQGLGSSNQDGARYGVGAQYLFDGKNGVRADYTRHDNDDFDSNSWSIAYVRKF